MSIIRSQALALDNLATIYVSTQGNDTNPGTSITKPVRTIARGVLIANSFITDESKRALVNIDPGIYEESSLPIRVKRNVAIKGDKLRSCYIRPAAGQEMNGFFKVDSNFMAWGLTLQGHQADESGNQAWAFSFDELADNRTIGAVSLGAYILASPYIQNCTSLTAEDDAGQAGSNSIGSTGGGMEVDGSKCAINSPIRSMVVDSFTQVNLGGPGCLVKNDGYAQLVSFFGTFCTYHVRTETGGQVNLSGGGTTDFGTYGLMADGYSPSPLYTGAARVATYGAARLEKVVTIDVSTDLFSCTSHGLLVNDQITFSATNGTLPTGLTTGTIYYVISSGLTANAFKVSTSQGGTALDLTGSATGTYKFIRQGQTQIDITGFSANRLGRQIKYPSAGSLGSPGNPVTISNRSGSTAGSSFTVTLATSTIGHEYTGGGTITVGGTSYSVTSATYNNATGITVLTAQGYAPTLGASITLAGLSFICNSASRPNAGQLMFPQLVFPRDASTGTAQAKTFAYTRTGNFTLTYQEAASPSGPDHEYVSGGTATIGSTNYGVAGATYDKTTGVVTLTTKTQLPAGNSNITVEGLVFICPTSAYIVTSSTPIDSSGNPVANNAANRAGYRVLFYSGTNGGLKDSIATGQRVDFRNRSQISAPSHTFEYVGSGTNYDALPWNGGIPIPANAIMQSNNGKVFSSNTNEKGDFTVGANNEFSVDGTTGAVTINTSQFNLSGLNFIGPFSRNGGISTVGVQLQEVSNNPALIASTGAADGNTAPTQAAVVAYLNNRFGNVDNTSDLSKPISTATQTALDLKAPLASPTFTGTVSGISKAMVGLGSVDNTSDANKPISTATQTALDLKANTTGTNATGTWGISITGNAATATNGVITTNSYADPAWITSLSASKLTGPILLLERTAQTAAYTLVLADAGQVVVMNASSAVTLTIPAEASVAFDVGTVIAVYNTSASTLTIAGATSPATVTVRNNASGLSQYQEVSLRKRASNEWVRIG